MRDVPRRPLLRAAAVLAAGSIALAACGQGEDPAAPDAGGDAGAGEVSIRFSWWGNDARTQKMRELIDIFEEDNPGIRVVPDFSDWGGYWDKLATQTAGGDTPDVMMQEDRYLGDYASRGVLADLGELDVDTSEIDEVLLGSGEFDGGLWGIPTGANVYAIHVNPQIFQDAGVELPDDTTWTWEDYVEVSEQITQQTPDGVYGTSDYSFNEVGLMVYLRQHGQELYGADGDLPYDDELVVEWFERSLELQDLGAQPTADETIGLDVGETPIATNKAAMSMTWSSQLAANAEVSGHELQLLRIPGETQFERPGMYFKPGMYVSIAASSEHPEAAALFADFLVNSVEVGEIMLAELGVPGNARVREHVTELLPPADQRVATFNEAISGDLLDAPPPMPVGAGQVADIMRRTNEAVLFGQLTPQEAAEQFRAEAQAAIG